MLFELLLRLLRLLNLLLDLLLYLLFVLNAQRIQAVSTLGQPNPITEAIQPNRLVFKPFALVPFIRARK